ncbi:MAG: tetratricopeptide repeat protein [Coleofasciculaceae cyanobacterium SM2_1_6]|nr:tetratricopeptide repeat protein [Coleofasciculaceae cyanobacterium SM2_1_6]
MARHRVNLVGVTPLLLGMMVAVPQMVAAPLVLAQSSQVAQSQRQFAEVKIDGLETYRHPSGLFSLDVPVGWTIKDTSKPDEIIISWTDLNTNSLVIMNVFEITNNPSAQELQSKLQNFIRDLFGSQPQFQLVDLSPPGDGSRGVSWSYQVTTTQVGGGTLQGKSLIVQSDNKVVILSIAYPQTQEAELQGSFNQIISSARIDSTINLSTATQGNQNSQQREAQQLYNEGERLRQQGTSESLQQALAKFQEALALFRADGDRKGEAETLRSIGEIYLRMDQPQQALNYAQQASAISGGMGDRQGEADILNTAANIYRQNIRQYQQTLSFYQQALPIYRAVNSPVYRVGNSPEERLSQRTGEADGGGVRGIVQPTEKVFTLNSIGRAYYSIGQQSIFIWREVNGGNSQQTVGRCGNSSGGNVGSSSIAGSYIFTPLCSSPPSNSSTGDVR